MAKIRFTEGPIKNPNPPEAAADDLGVVKMLRESSSDVKRSLDTL